MSKQEVVYLVRDDRLWVEGVHKVGRSSDWKKRRHSYGGARVLRVKFTTNSALVEKRLIQSFNENFVVAKGSEYFFCPEKRACEIFDGVCTQESQNMSRPIEMTEDDSPKQILGERIQVNPTKNLKMGSKKTPSPELFECETCGFETSQELSLAEHMREHNKTLGLKCRMKCNACCFDAEYAPILWGHIQKKRHKATIFYMKAVSEKRKKTEAYSLLKYVYGEKTADKVIRDICGNENGCFPSNIDPSKWPFAS
nr:hypothetical protein [Marseillevirus cajuinensis]